MNTTASEAARAEASSGLRLVLPGKGLAAGEGMTWIVEGWKLFAKAPLMWIISLVILIVLAFLSNLVIFVGPIVYQILTPVFGAGFVIACRSLERGGEFELEHLFAGFKGPYIGNLILVGLIFIAAGLAIVLIGAMLMGASVFMALAAGAADVETITPAAIAGSALTIVLALLVMMALMVPLMMLYWFAPALVVMHGMGPWAAMKASFWGCLRNFLGFIIYGIVMFVLAIVAAIPLLLGYLVWIPVMITSTYAAYRAIFTEDEAPAPPVRATLA